MTAETQELDRVFGLVANEVRVSILRHLWEARLASETPVSFSALREQVDIKDSGRFNYHLDKLIPAFVQQPDDGYELTYAGRQIIGAAVSGTFTETEQTELDAVEVGDCVNPDCGGTNTASYADGYVSIGCDTCEVMITDGMPAPPILIAAHDPASDPSVLGSFLTARAQQHNRGFCFLCSGPIDRAVTRFHPEFEANATDEDSRHVDVVTECRECGSWWHSVASLALIDHPSLISLLYDLGIDYRSVPLWEQRWMSEVTEAVVSSDPVRVECSLSLEGRSLEVLLDESLNETSITDRD